MAKPLHIMPSGERWEVIREDEYEVLAEFENRDEAIAWAEDQAADAEQATVIVHRDDFSVETEAR